MSSPEREHTFETVSNKDILYFCGVLMDIGLTHVTEESQSKVSQFRVYSRSPESDDDPTTRVASIEYSLKNIRSALHEYTVRNRTQIRVDNTEAVRIARNLQDTDHSADSAYDLDVFISDALSAQEDEKIAYARNRSLSIELAPYPDEADTGLMVLHADQQVESELCVGSRSDKVVLKEPWQERVYPADLKDYMDFYYRMGVVAQSVAAYPGASYGDVDRFPQPGNTSWGPHIYRL